MAKDNYTPTVTPLGEARFPKINEPDTKGEYADGKYKIEVVLNEANTKLYKKELHDVAARIFPGVKGVRIPMKTAKDGTISFIFKSKDKPMILDAKKNKLPPEVVVGAGSSVRVAGSLAKYEKGPNKGITAYLSAVQVVELVEGGSMAKLFDVEDGFVADPQATTAEGHHEDAGEALEL